MKPNDGEAQERDGVLGAKNPFLIHIHMKKLVKRFDIANAAAIGA